MQKPYISFIFSIQVNESRGNNILKHFQSSLDILRNLGAKHKLNFEIIIVEWNPLGDTLRLKDVLKLNDKLDSMVRVITVPPEVHKSIPNTPFDAVKGDEITFHEFVAKNVAIRRAGGEYILCSNADIIFNDKMIAMLAEHRLSDKYFYRVNCYDVQKTIPGELSIVEDILDFCASNCKLRGKKVEPGHIHRKGAGNFLLMARRNWERIRGYAEIKCDGEKIDSDILDSASRFYRQTIFDDVFRIYHQHHINKYERDFMKELHCRKNYREVYKLSKGLNKIMLKKIRMFKILNNKKWGLIDHSLPEEQII